MAGVRCFPLLSLLAFDVSSILMMTNDLNLLPLPPQVVEICKSVAASPRLIAHLTLVHDLAARLTAELQKCFPAVSFNVENVLFGAATHDIGKAIHPDELVEAGNLHELDGVELLIKHGVNLQMARFTRTHAAWKIDESLNLEDWLVALADTCWKGKRIAELESIIAEHLAQIIGKEEWEVFVMLDDIISKLAANADKRLAWQSQFSAE